MYQDYQRLSDIHLAVFVGAIWMAGVFILTNLFENGAIMVPDRQMRHKDYLLVKALSKMFSNVWMLGICIIGLGADSYWVAIVSCILAFLFGISFQHNYVKVKKAYKESLWKYGN